MSTGHGLQENIYDEHHHRAERRCGWQRKWGGKARKLTAPKRHCLHFAAASVPSAARECVVSSKPKFLVGINLSDR